MGGRPGYGDDRPHGRYAGRSSGGYGKLLLFDEIYFFLKLGFELILLYQIYEFVFSMCLVSNLVIGRMCDEVVNTLFAL